MRLTFNVEITVDVPDDMVDAVLQDHGTTLEKARKEPANHVYNLLSIGNFVDLTTAKGVGGATVVGFQTEENVEADDA